MPAIHKGPLRRIRPWWAPWQTANWCVRWAMKQLQEMNEVPCAIEQVKQELADAAEVQRILETL